MDQIKKHQKQAITEAKARTAQAQARAEQAKAQKKQGLAKEHGGREGLEPTRFGDWEKKGLISDF